MDVSVWWVVAAAAIGVCVGIVLFAVLTMAADRDPDAIDERATPTLS